MGSSPDPASYSCVQLVQPRTHATGSKPLSACAVCQASAFMKRIQEETMGSDKDRQLLSTPPPSR